MTTSLRPLDARAILGRREWAPPIPFGPDGWRFDRYDGDARIIVTCSPMPDDPREWVHASISHPDRLPTYDDLVTLHRALFPAGYAYQAFVPPSEHVDLHPFALHLWGLADGTPALPRFGMLGTI